MKKINKLAIYGGKSIRTIPFPPHNPVIGPEEIKAITKVLKSRRLSIFSGSKVREFEKAFAKYHKCRFAIATSSGTAALHCSIAASKIGPGDEVIVPISTFISTPMSVLHQNAIPRFVDVSINDGNIDPKKIKNAINKRTKAIIPVHLRGNPCDMDEIMKIAADYKLVVIEDACQAHGASYKGKKVGTIGDLGCFSFFETKNMTAGGEGGMVITNDKELARRARLMVHLGECYLDGTPSTESVDYSQRVHYATIGWNYRMTEIQAAIGLVQLNKLDSFVEKRRKNAGYLIRHIKNIPGLGIPSIPKYSKPAFYIFPFFVEDMLITRDDLYKALIAEGIPASIPYYTLLNENPLFLDKVGYGNTKCPFYCRSYNKNFRHYNGEFPVVREIYSKSILLRVDPNLGINEMRDTVKAIEKIVSFYRKE